MSLLVDGRVVESTSCATSTGSYQFDTQPMAGQVYAVVPAATGSSRAMRIAKAAAALDVAGFDVTLGELTVASPSAITTSDLLPANAESASASPITAAIGTAALVQISSPIFMQVRTGTTITADIELRTDALRIATGGTYQGGSVRTTLTGGGIGPCSGVVPGRSMCNLGTFAPQTGTVVYSPTSATSVAVPGGAYHGIEVSPVNPGQTVQAQIGTSDAMLITAVRLDLDGSQVAALNATTTAVSPTVTISGAMQVGTGATLSGSGTGTWNVGGDIYGHGNVNLVAGTVELRSAGVSSQLNATGTLPGTPWQFATLVVSSSAASRTVTIPATSRGVRFSVLLQLGRASDANTSSLDASGLTELLMVTGDVDVTSKGRYAMPLVTEVHGNATNNGTLVPGTGLLRVRGAGTSVLTGTGSGGLYDLTVDAPSKTVTIGAPLQVSHVITLAGGSCASPVALASTALGIRRAITNNAVIGSYATLRDLGFSMPVSVTGMGDLGNNANVAFGDEEVCSAPTSLHTDSLDAGSGAINATSVDGAAPFHMSFRNSTTAASDRYRTEITSSALDSTVAALWPLNGTASDRAAVPHDGVVTGGMSLAASGAANFGQAATFDGVDDSIEVPSAAEFDATQFTVETWVNGVAIPPASTATLVSRSANVTNSQFAIWTDSAQQQLHATVTAGGVVFGTATPAAPWFDGSWHHVAMSVDASKQIRLYVDGVQYGATATYGGTLDNPAAPVRIGSAGAVGSYFTGMLDDVQISTVARTQAALAGYVETRRPHAESIWRSANYSGDGAALTSSCAPTARCTDTMYGGPNIHREGARYFVVQQLRTTSGLWSARATDWFETSSSITMSAPGAISLSGAGGADLTTSFSVTSTCSSGAGCDLAMHAPSDAVALVHDATSAVIGPIAPASPSLPGSWLPGASLGLGFTVLSSTSGKDVGRWGNGVDTSDLGLLNFIGVTRRPVLLQHWNGGAPETTTLTARLNVPISQPPGGYFGSVTIVAVPAP